MTKSHCVLQLIITVSIFSGLGCAKARFYRPEDVNAAQTILTCSVETLENGDAQITCPDGTTAVIHQGVDGADGVNGTDGVDGINGVDGRDGTSCSVVEELNGAGALIVCGSSSVLVKHGRDGQDGEDGEDGEDGADAPISAFQMTELIDPCGREGDFDEVLIRFSNGDVLAHYSHGNKQFLTLLRAGYNYVTTDGTSCRFSLQSDGTIVDENGTRWSP